MKQKINKSIDSQYGGHIITGSASTHLAILFQGYFKLAPKTALSLPFICIFNSQQDKTNCNICSRIQICLFHPICEFIGKPC